MFVAADLVNIMNVLECRVSDPASEILQISTDSRQITRGSQSLFVALRGKRTDGHRYLRAAWACGVRNFVVESRLVRRDEADTLARHCLKGLSSCMRFREENILSLKLFDPWIVQEMGDIILLDSDVLIFRRRRLHCFAERRHAAAVEHR